MMPCHSIESQLSVELYNVKICWEIMHFYGTQFRQPNCMPIVFLWQPNLIPGFTSFTIRIPPCLLGRSCVLPHSPYTFLPLCHLSCLYKSCTTFIVHLLKYRLCDLSHSLYLLIHRSCYLPHSLYTGLLYISCDLPYSHTPTRAQIMWSTLLTINPTSWTDHVIYLICHAPARMSFYINTLDVVLW